MDSTVYNSLKRLRIDDTDEDRQTKRPSMESWSSQRPGGGPFMSTLQATQHNNGAASNSHDHGAFNNVFTSFMVSTKTNTQYNTMNQVLNGVHMNRYGNPQRQEGCNGAGIDDSQPMEDVSFYLAANTILREAFLQRHRHPDDDPSS
ncbi:hypothetical protein O0I10_000847 [Lichtheimia ornata]|uniref:Uncharacterized protein n=1 Tax=Lichtheimia ornata TaxID=688661 RepID=A0AAD8DJF7_9FUNG|nr:uncharacterized protein O0I10_000847 [Lichtheimia ornata]KAJ8663602.1 hypothetical protein O0I10_000847 [Lichtheimia ornata]